jgi:glycosyltransferase involved in cell wall biosynthesis
MSSRPIARVVPFQPHCFAFGGFEIQMIGAMEAAREAGADVAPLDFWSREPDFDLLHLWGWGLEHRGTVHWAKAGGKKILLSALVRYPGWASRLLYLASYLWGPARLKRPMIAELDGITVVNRQQKDYLTGIVGFPADRVFVIPNIVEEIFFAPPTEPNEFDPQLFDPGIENYAICAGNVCPRKNQLALAKACRKIGVPLLLVGPALTGEAEYARAVEDEIANNPMVRWVKGLPPASPQLASAYRRAAVFALPSYNEEQPISALEAAASGMPLVLSDRPYARQDCYAGALAPDPKSVDAIAAALRRALDRPDKHRPPASAIADCRRPIVGRAYANAYRALLGQKRSTG